MPKFIVKPSNVEVLEYEESRFDTEISGKPQPSVEWSLANKVLKPSDRIIYGQEDAHYWLIIKKTKADEAGMVNVKATNEMGNMSASARLKVTRKSSILAVDVFCYFANDK